MVTQIKKQWSRGGAMFHVIYLAVTKRYFLAVLATILLFIPWLNFIVAIGLFIWGGLQGNAWIESDDSLTSEQKLTYTTFLERVGYVFFLILVVILCIFLVMMLIGGGMLMLEADRMQQMFDMPGGGMNFGADNLGDIVIE